MSARESCRWDYMDDNDGEPIHSNTILSLFDASGAWSEPWWEAGYNVIECDLANEIDVRDIDCAWLNENVFDMVGDCVEGILSAPPCTDFAVSGAQYWRAKDEDGRTEQSLAMIRITEACVEYCKPNWWVMENPVGRLNKLMPSLSEFGPWYFHPWEYAGWADDPSKEAYTKKTGLWGEFSRSKLAANRRPVEPVRACKAGSWLMKLGGKSEKTKALRSVTPVGFARAFFDANRYVEEKAVTV